MCLVRLAKVIQTSHHCVDCDPDDVWREVHGTTTTARQALQDLVTEIKGEQIVHNGKHYQYTPALETLVITRWHDIESSQLMSEKVFQRMSAWD